MKRLPITSIALENASIGYSIDDAVAQNVNFELPLGQTYWLKGESGAGKSALLKIFSGLMMPPEGVYKVNGQSVEEMSFQEFLPYRLNIGYGFDFGGLLNNRTLYDNLLLPLEYHREISRDEAKERIDSYFEFFNLSSYKNIRPAMVGGSFRKLTCILRAFIQKPTFVLLDDVTTGLSEVHLKNLVRWLQKYGNDNPNCSIIFTSQDSFMFNQIQYQQLWVGRADGLTVRKKEAA